MKNLILLFGFWISIPSFAVWDLNDVSYLMPLPQSLENDQLLRPQTVGLGGPILSPDLIEQIPRLTPQFTQAQVIQNLRVLAVRIDPCFPLPTPMECQKQIRFIWQVLTVGTEKQVETVDTTLHSFYQLSEKQFQDLLAELTGWKEKYQISTQGLALQVHPAWVSNADQTPSLLEFQKILLKSVGRTNLIRITAMLLRGAGDMWAFETFEFRDGILEMQPIPRLNGQQAQAFINFAVPATHFKGAGINPRPTGPDVLNTIAADSSMILTGHEDVIQQEFEVIAKIENPQKFSPENMDCVTCHVAQPAKHWVFNHRGDLNLAALWPSLQYQNPRYNLENLTVHVENTQNLRAFGYFGRQATFSQRVINESAEVADHLNRQFQTHR